MALFGRDYDRDYDTGYRSSRGGRSFWGSSGAPMRPNNDLGNRSGAWGPGNERSWQSRDRGSYRGSDYRYAGYDRGYKSQHQTDHGDPFGDREQGTPMRVIRGEARGYDRGYRDGGYDRGYRDAGYDRNFHRSGESHRGYGNSGWPMGYRQDSERQNVNANINNQRTYRTYGRSYDDGWF
jgi:hypothetical protein